MGAGTLSLNGWNVFSEALRATTCLDSLILCDNEFSNQGYTLLSHGIGENSSLRAVSFSACCFNGRGSKTKLPFPGFLVPCLALVA
jgi:hypothetical protein